MFLENDMVNESDSTQAVGFEKDQSKDTVPTSSYQLVVFGDAHQNQVTQAPRQVKPILKNPVEQHPIQDVDQPVERQPPPKVEDVAFRRSTRIRK